MFSSPKKIKYKKVRKGNLKRLEYKSNSLKFGEMGLKSISSGIVSARQIEAARRAIVKKTERKGKVWIRIFPDFPVTSKPSESRMGKGVGSLSHWGVKVKAGTVLFELTGIKKKEVALESLKLAGDKLPVSTKIFF